MAGKRRPRAVQDEVHSAAHSGHRLRAADSCSCVAAITMATAVAVAVTVEPVAHQTARHQVGALPYAAVRPLVQWLQATEQVVLVAHHPPVATGLAGREIFILPIHLRARGKLGTLQLSTRSVPDVRGRGHRRHAGGSALLRPRGTAMGLRPPAVALLVVAAAPGRARAPEDSIVDTNSRLRLRVSDRLGVPAQVPAGERGTRIVLKKTTGRMSCLAGRRSRRRRRIPLSVMRSSVASSGNVTKTRIVWKMRQSERSSVVALLVTARESVVAVLLSTGEDAHTLAYPRGATRAGHICMRRRVVSGRAWCYRRRRHR